MHPDLNLHIVTDSGFGSFELLGWCWNNGVHATMSMPSKQKGWLWGSLGYACPLEAGRTALVSVGSGQALASLFRTISETGRRSEEHTSELQSLMRISYAV